MYWALFILSCIVVLTLLIAALGFLFNDSTDDSAAAYLLPTSCLFTGFILLTGKEIFPVLTIILVWKTSVAIIFLISLLLFLRNRKKSKNYFVSMLLSLLLSSIPYISRFTVQPSNTTVPFLEYFNIEFPMIILSFWLPLSVICLLTAFVFSNKKQKYYIAAQQTNSNFERSIYSQDIENKNYENKNFEQILFKLSLENLSEKISSNNVSLSNQFGKLSKSIEELRNIYLDQFILLQNYSNDGNKGSLPSTFIDNLEKDISVIKSTILQGQNIKPSEANNQTIIRELYHFFATPLASIEANCIFIKSKIPSSEKGKVINDCLDKINTSVNIFKGVLNTYREIELLPSTNSNFKLSELISSSFEVYKQKESKDISIDIQLSDSYSDLNPYYLMSTLLPLLENAVVASKEKSTIQIVEKENTILISNTYIKNVEVNDIMKNGFSTKKEHIGTGLFIVRHLLNARDLGDLQCYKKDSHIVFEIPIKKY